MIETLPFKAATLISNGLAVPVLFLSLIVIAVWYRPVVATCKNFIKSPEQWFILGVFLGFLGEFLDNFYWTITWALRYLDSSYTELFMNSGVYSNIPFRQILGISAAYCHIRSAIEYKRTKSNNSSNKIEILNIIIIATLLLGVLFAGGLFYLNNF